MKKLRLKWRELAEIDPNSLLSSKFQARGDLGGKCPVSLEAPIFSTESLAAVSPTSLPVSRKEE